MAGPSLNLRRLPNSPALIHLYRQYHEDRETDVRSDSDHVSSHWQSYSHASRVVIDSEANLQGLHGEGFGAYQQERWLRRLADYLCCAIHFLRAENKIEIVRLTRVALSLAKKIPFGHHYLSYDLFRQVHALATIGQHYHPHRDDKFTVLVIGDGFGFLSALTKAIYPSSSFVLVDIGRTLFFQCLYLQVIYPTHAHMVVGSGIKDGHVPAVDFLYCPAEKLEELKECRYRLAMNVCSMQEMNKTEIERYFKYLWTHAEGGAMFYCCNRESKVLPDGELVEFDGYPWLSTDRHLIDGHSSVYSFWFSTRRNRNKPKWRGLTVPFPFLDGPDGPVRHRLTVL